MLVLLKFPYVLKQSKREEIVEKYTKMLNDGHLVLAADPLVQIEVYNNFDETDNRVEIVTNTTPNIERSDEDG